MASLPESSKNPQFEGSSSTVGSRRETPRTHNDGVVREDELRAILSDQPNDIEAFNELVRVVTYNLAECVEGVDPLTADGIDESLAEKAKMARWALAEEYSGNPRAWRPLLCLAELSIREQPAESFRRINTALERDHSGEALSEAVSLLIAHDESLLAYSQARGHWKVREHIPEAGLAVIKAALTCGKTFEAEKAMQELLTVISKEELVILDSALVAKLGSSVQAH